MELNTGCVGLREVLRGFTGFFWVPLSFDRFDPISPGYGRFYWVLPCFLGATESYWGLSGFARFYRVLMGFDRFE